MIFKSIFILLLTSSIVAEDGESVPDIPMPVPADSSPGDSGTNVTEHMKEERTTIPESDIEEALNLDYGRYTPMKFQYHNDQNFFNHFHDGTTDKCAHQWMKCLISLSSLQMVCAVHNVYMEKHRGITRYNNQCDMHFDNCRHWYRHWRIVDTGECYRADKNIHINFWIPERRINSIWDFFNPKNSTS